ncbi:hypothetical protein BJX68DRAFT_240252 [Aspergillus pseudodeflectus]|uniref:Zn(2)-C6 fungal-type domain-containing protein n=1 Tax=Aspergillus pseudodeflectus TaxID=176178 RepID=A0ABR4K480_9EURO
MASLPSLRPNRPLPDTPPWPTNRVVLPPRRKISLACTNCRSKKIRCDGTSPFCSECIRSGSRCLYENVDKRKTETWRIAVNDLEQKNHQLDSLVQSLKCNSFPEAVERLRQLRGDQHQQPDRHEEITVGTPGFSDTSSSSFGLATSINPYLAASVDRPSASRSVSDNDGLVDLGYANLPCEDMTRHAVNSFKTCGATLFHVMSQETLDDLIQKVYQHDPGVTPSDVCQLCALAAVGSQYCTNEIPASAKEAYYQHAFVLLDQLEDDDVAHMRVFTCLAVYLVMLKSTSARTMTASGLHVARTYIETRLQDTNEEDRLEWARVYRTLAGTECWLSSTLGYELGLRADEIKLIDDLADAESAMNPNNEINSRIMQRYVFNVAFLSAQVYECFRLSDHICMDDLHTLSAQLDTWHRELPPCLQLSSLTSGESNASECVRRPLLFMHMTHISSHITLYERVMYTVLKEAMGASDKQMIREVFRLPADAIRIYGSFAQQLARIVKLLYDEEAVLVRCWLTIHASFHATIVLLMLATQHLALAVPQPSILKDMEHIRACLKVLQYCANYDIAAMRLVDIVSPLINRLWQMIENPNDVDKIAPSFSLSESPGAPRISAGLAHVVHQLVATMGLKYQEIWV